MLCTGFLNLKVDLFAGSSSEDMANQVRCGLKESFACRDKGFALSLKLAAIATILIASALGVALPLLGRRIKALRPDGTLFVITKAFAAGVILATGFVHMLPDGMESLNNDCLPEIPFHKFPVSSCIAMLAALGTLLVDVLGTEYYEKKHFQGRETNEGHAPPPSQVEWDELPSSISIDTELDKATQLSDHTNGDHMHIVGMHAHAASHGHSHPHGHHSCVDTTHEHVHGQFGHSYMSSTLSEDALAHIRHVIVSQVLEFGIVAHSIIIGFSLGVSQSPCIIRPLLAALSFHQFFEGLALGGCISQAGFKSLSSVVMASCFAVTTPIGIAVGIGVASSYNSNSRSALIVEGVFDSISAGILVYMALVDLIAADFLSKRMSCNRRLQVMSYTTLFLGAAAMSALAIWA